MKKINFIRFVSIALAAIAVQAAHADQNGESIAYLGVGAAKKGNATESSRSPFAIGYLKLSNTSNAIWGFDFSREGTMLDSTWSQNNAVKQASSYNLLFGTNFSKSENYRVDFALLAGAREKTSDCPSSFLGYQCYANAKPDTSYAFNYGAVISYTYKSLMLGVRATGESAQGLLGLRF